jgi:hypothetical protein
MANALAFFPARSVITTALLRFYPDRIVATGTDTYTLGRDECPAEDWRSAEVADFPVEVELDRDGLKEIEDQCRRDKGNIATLEYRPGDCLTFFPGGSGTEKRPTATTPAKDMTHEGTTFLVDKERVERKTIWELTDVLLERMRRQEMVMPDGPMAFDPTYFGRFGKVKVDKNAEADTILDLIYQGEELPMLAKVGPTFIGAIMPINRERYASRQPQGREFLWW